MYIYRDLLYYHFFIIVISIVIIILLYQLAVPISSQFCGPCVSYSNEMRPARVNELDNTSLEVEGTPCVLTVSPPWSQITIPHNIAHPDSCASYPLICYCSSTHSHQVFHGHVIICNKVHDTQRQTAKKINIQSIRTLQQAWCSPPT